MRCGGPTPAILRYDPAFIGYPEARAYIETEMRKWRQAVKDAGVKRN